MFPWLVSKFDFLSAERPQILENKLGNKFPRPSQYDALYQSIFHGHISFSILFLIHSGFTVKVCKIRTFFPWQPSQFFQVLHPQRPPICEKVCHLLPRPQGHEIGKNDPDMFKLWKITSEGHQCTLWVQINRETPEL